MSMNLYTISSLQARKHGAIGIFYRVTEQHEAKDAAEAEAWFRSKYETNAPPVVTLMATGTDYAPR